MCILEYIDVYLWSSMCACRECISIYYISWAKIETLHFTKLRQTHYLKQYVRIKATRVTKTTMQKSFKLDQAFTNNVEKNVNSIL